ncbi:histidinol dehydrogenase [Paraflavitalea sp. CAU 1676]|uniref:histidinol dehydrogenase n=1 Tax=Paraflavitalea sp. CAU 1676 TaxID=3032598 RepID=UPI0023DB145E|nr:histidinol dehydrogenase [Paraflavitalea sp. CAU 1676]MDF2190230.1 histidinol dehydrogenase [Paraflavitalea sp. CAU 1676]
MKVYDNPARSEWNTLLQRPVAEAARLEEIVSGILQQVKTGGDAAVKALTLQFDKAVVDDLQVSESEFRDAASSLDEALKTAILTAKANIETFHRRQLSEPEMVETMPGVQCWRKAVAIEKVGLYIPGGTAPLFSTILMLGVPARLAGCKEIVLCSPPDKQGKLHPAILFAAEAVGVTKVFKAGGVQAIGAMAYGTATIPKVSKIFGPGNQYVTCAKQLIQQEGIAIDMPAGPSEVAVYADASANASFVAADLLSQAEHGVDSQVILVVREKQLVAKVQQELDTQLAVLPRKDLAAKALENSKIFVITEEATALELLNEYAAEHLILACDNAGVLARQVVNAGSVFLGHYSPESVGDYASGTNHTLPTNGYAKAYSGVSVDSFVKKITFQQLTRQGLQMIGRTVELMAEAEGLEAHANAVRVRMGK